MVQAWKRSGQSKEYAVTNWDPSQSSSSEACSALFVDVHRSGSIPLCLHGGTGGASCPAPGGTHNFGLCRGLSWMPGAGRPVPFSSPLPKPRLPAMGLHSRSSPSHFFLSAPARGSPFCPGPAPYSPAGPPLSSVPPLSELRTSQLHSQL